MIYLLRRFSAFLLSFFFCLTLLVPSALADDGFTSSGGSDFDNDYGVRWSGFVDDGSSTGVFVKAPDMWAAAVYACGGNPGLLSAEVRSKLSDPDYGGRFYAYAQSFGHIMSVSEIPNWVPLYILAAEGIANVWHGEFGDMLLWSSKVPNSLITGALIDYRRVLAGEDLSGGSGGTGSDVPNLPEGDYYKIPVSPSSYTGASIPSAFSQYANLEYMYVHVDFYANLMSWLSSRYGNFYPYLVMRRDTGVPNAFGILTYASRGVSVDGNYRGVNNGDLGFSGRALFFENYCVLFWQSGNFSQAWYNSGTVVSGNNHTPFYFVQRIDPTGCPVVHLPDNLPNGDWPEPSAPSVPSAPDLPGPAEPTVTPEPTVTTPTPTWPDVNITVNPPAVVAPVTPDGLDYTELLTRINDNLNSINSYVVAVNSSLNSLRSDLVTEFASVVQSLRNIYGYLQHMDSVLEVHCVHIRNKIEESAVFIANYMRSLVHWLAEQLDYDDTYGTDSYDDSLLTTINEKLGGGTYEPNPIKDELGYYEWLDDLWDRFLLGDDWQSSASSISASFGQLRTRFPFSIPWDIVALFRLFVHEPVTPVFDLPLYFSGSSSTPVRVDLTPWDGVASVVRPLIYVIFALKLALLSRDLLAGLGADKGGLS